MSDATALLIAISWKSSLLVLLVKGVTALAQSMSSATRHTIWLLIVLSLLALPILELLLPHYRFDPLGTIVTEIEHLFRNNKNLPSIAYASPVASAWLDRIGDLGIFASDGTISADKGFKLPWLLLVWGAGALFCAARSVADYRAVNKIVRRARPVAWSIDVQFKGVCILETNELATPVASGMFRPIILFPTVATEWPQERRNVVLAHELAHIRRRDPLIQIAVEAVRVLHWYNPLVRHALRRLEADREFACDDLVIASGVDPTRYATALVASARDVWCATSARGGALGILRPSELSVRCQALFDTRRRGEPSLYWKACAAAGCIVLILPLIALGPTSSVEARVSAPRQAALDASADNRSDDADLAKRLQDARSEFVPANYDELLQRAIDVRADGPDAALIASLKGQLNRVPRGYADLVRERAIWCLVEVRNGELVNPLIERLHDENWRVRAYAAWCLGVSRDAAAIEPLKKLLLSHNWRERAMSVFSLAAIGGPEIRLEMAAATKDKAWQVRIAAVDYFAQSGDRSALVILQPLLSDPHEGVRAAATAATLKIHG